MVHSKARCGSSMTLSRTPQRGSTHLRPRVLTPAQQQGWKGFFESIRRLKTGLKVTAVNVAGGTAEAIVSGVYDYENVATGRAERRPVTFRAILVAEPGGWRLSVIR